MNRIAGMVAAASLWVGCGDSLGPSDAEVVGALMHASEEFGVRVVIPDTVYVGETFRVDITTYHGCWLGEGRTAVAVDHLRATVIPYKRFLGHRPACPDIVFSPRRTVNVQFDEPGLGVITVVGLSRIRFPGEQADTLRVVREVLVK